MSINLSAKSFSPLLYHFFIMSGSIRLPNDDKNGYFKKARNWLKNQWNGEPNERSPLLNDQQESKRKTKFRVIFSSISLLIALIILGLTIRYWFKHHDKEVDGKDTNKARNILTTE